MRMKVPSSSFFFLSVPGGWDDSTCAIVQCLKTERCDCVLPDTSACSETDLVKQLVTVDAVAFVISSKALASSLFSRLLLFTMATLKKKVVPFATSDFKTTSTPTRALAWFVVGG
eukprot:gb/GEZN01020148.1/.p1 GENE.gb/GEZN01020148.1/~~gb/GEZN01020148.1/.p1  ORF type:complete len:127 (-),score=12.58 gb/GEZN01020148.1/:314-658(-)